jgi:hypothetical protein
MPFRRAVNTRGAMPLPPTSAPVERPSAAAPPAPRDGLRWHDRLWIYRLIAQLTADAAHEAVELYRKRVAESSDRS